LTSVRAGAGRAVGVAGSLLDVFHIYALKTECTRAGGILNFRSSDYDADLVENTDMIWYCYRNDTY
jgi:hypothetical protein